MSQKVQILRLLVEQRLTVAAEEIFGLFERTIAEYEEELCRTKEENQRQRQILDSVWNPTVLTDVQQLSMVKEEVPPERREWNPIVDHEEPEVEPPHIKEEQEELWPNQEVIITKFPSTPVPVKSNDDDEEKVKCSQLNQTQTEENKAEANEVDCGGSEPSSSFHPHRHLQTKIDEQVEDSEETEYSDEDQILNHKLESKLPTNSSTKQMELETDGDDSEGSEPDTDLVHSGQKLVGSSECEATFSQKKNTTNNNLTDLSDVGCEKKVYKCSVCPKTFCWRSSLKIHTRIHTGEKPFCCSVCGSRFTHKSSLCSHMTSHSGEKPFTCSLCHKCFGDRSKVKRHMRVHTGEKPFDCSVCGKSFTNNVTLTGHMRLHTGEKPFSCSECGKRFAWKTVLERHMRLHTGEKLFSCSECSKKFNQKIGLTRHMMLHTGERPFSCVVCQKRFTRKYHLKTHMKIHSRE